MGIDDRPVETDRKIQSIGAEETYEEDLTDGRAIELEFRYFANVYRNGFGDVPFMDILYLSRFGMMILPPYHGRSG